MDEVIGEVQEALRNWREFRLRLFMEGSLVGLVAGVIVVLFRFFLERAEELRSILYGYMHDGSLTIVAAWFLTLLGVAWLLGLILTVEPMSAGSGIPQVKGAILGLVKMNWSKILVTKFIGGVLAIGAGLSLGREGPSIQIGAVVGQGISRILRRANLEEQYLLTSGASAGLAAAFNAPLAGVIFSLEELHKNFSPAVLSSAIAASLTADLVVRYCYGREPFWNLTGIPVLPLQYYDLLIVLGGVAGLLGVAFNQLLIKALDAYARQRIVPKVYQAAIPLLVGGLVGVVLPEVLGGGNTLIDTIAADRFGVVILLVLLGAKFSFTMLSYGSGVPGGIFLPMLVIGALIGGAFSKAVFLLGIQHSYHATFVVLAMAAYFTAIVKAPITGSILITEMTGSFRHLPEMIFICMIAYVVVDIAKSKPVYDLLLDRSLQQRKPPARSEGGETAGAVVELVVGMGSMLAGQKLGNIEWPSNCLLIYIRRGEQEIVLQDDIELAVGDYLYVSAAEGYIMEIKARADECFRNL
ncbi:MAG TPA: ClC family H(+)/Cl(-) exchange transporter [Selenomonadales bacterium]|nr:ClC family H(+)/Cl(-) exchange transporter [Selenomonadales bacterium]